MKRTLLSCSLLLAVSGAAVAGTPISQTRSVDAHARIDVSNIKGAVTVSGWDKAEVSITGTLGDGAKGLSVEGGSDHLTIKVEAPDKQGWFSWGAESRMGDTTLDLKVPREAEMKIEVVSADVALSGVAGRSLDVNSVSGKLRLDSDAKEVEVDSVSGNVDLTGKAERGHLETVSGNIRARGLGGQIKFETVSGDIDAENGDYREISAGTVSGDINLRGKPTKDARIDVETMSGDVHLYLPADVSAHLRATTFSGSIRSDFGSVKEEEHGPGSNLDATTGSGDARVTLETFSGDVEVRRQ
ncbi:MAG TPA: DUF4097 family beta strand repeat-containing protein [Rhodanobacteraceae bacterium]|jgi:DUF4097 and DUF4098 domain-containing protein YvlB|nr:DUF4097 family beta strand repeat-containing protein [Rhodanobacteraceae bacterium]